MQAVSLSNLRVRVVVTGRVREKVRVFVMVKFASGGRQGATPEPEYPECSI